MSDSFVTHPEITIAQGMIELQRCIKKGLVPLFHGSPGVAKTSMMRQFAEKFKLFYIDIRLSTYDPTDLHGYPGVNQETKRSTFFTPEDFPIEGDDLPDGYVGWLVGFDEIGSCVPAVQAAAYKVLQEKEVGNKKLHPMCFMAAATNKITDNAVVYELGTAMQSRFIHYVVKSHVPGWLLHAEGADFDHRVRSYVEISGEVNMFDPDHDEMTFTCERTWEFASNLIEDDETLSYQEHLPCLAGALGLGMANTFIQFCEIYNDIPSIKDIEADPINCKLPDDQTTLLAFANSLAKHIDQKNIAVFMKYVYRFHVEFQVITLQNIIKTNKDILEHPEVEAWMDIHADRLAS